MRKKVRITTDGPFQAKVELDDADISPALRGVELTMEVGHLPSVRLDLAVFEIDATADGAQIHLTTRARDLLIALGWEPPASEGGT